MPGGVLEKVKLSEPKMGVPYNLYFRLDHFAGCRIGLFNYAAKELGGEVVFREFRYIYEE